MLPYSPVLARRVGEALRRDGVDVVCGVEVERVAAADGGKVVHGRVAGASVGWSGEQLLIAVGRVPNIDGLGLERLGIQVGGDGVVVDERRRTAVRTVYAVEDVVGRARFTHAAGYEAARAVRDVFFPGRGRAEAPIPWVTYTDPELAHSGLNADEARAKQTTSRSMCTS